MVKAKKKTKWRSLALENDDPANGSADGGIAARNGRNDWKLNSMNGTENNENGSHHNVNGHGGGGGGRYGRRDGRASSTTKSSSTSSYSKYRQASVQVNSQTEPKKVQFNEGRC